MVSIEHRREKTIWPGFADGPGQRSFISAKTRKSAFHGYYQGFHQSKNRAWICRPSTQVSKACPISRNFCQKNYNELISIHFNEFIIVIVVAQKFFEIRILKTASTGSSINPDLIYVFIFAFPPLQSEQRLDSWLCQINHIKEWYEYETRKP